MVVVVEVEVDLAIVAIYVNNNGRDKGSYLYSLFIVLT
jgi:predicted secreted protein